MTVLCRNESTILVMVKVGNERSGYKLEQAFH